MLSDPAIKLFGKTIPLPESSVGSVNNSLGAPSRSWSSSSERNDNEEDEDIFGGKTTETKQEDEAPPLSSGDLARADEMTEMNEDPEATSTEKKTAASSTIAEEEKGEISVSEEKALKKPDKILPCPRCSSMDTKFCYFNNYNVNQPRHFCRNCQRYWTAGGTMRNVPVGAGRRKNKNSATQYRQITVSEALHHAAQKDVQNGTHQPPQRSNGTVLSFTSDAPLCESVASVLNITENISKSSRNGIHQPEELKNSGPDGREGNKNDHVSGSSDQDSNRKNNQAQVGVQEDLMQNFPYIPPIPCYPGAHWPYPWNPMVSPPGFPMPFYPPAAYWGCPIPGTWNVPWVVQPSASSHTTQNSGPDSPTLGKHSRDESVPKPVDCVDDDQAKENRSERSLWIPKTLRIDDPGEAAKSSIWATLGIKNDKVGSFGGQGLFRAFQSEVDENGHSAEAFPVLQANPAALSRSVNFREHR